MALPGKHPSRLVEPVIGPAEGRTRWLAPQDDDSAVVDRETLPTFRAISCEKSKRFGPQSVSTRDGSALEFRNRAPPLAGGHGETGRGVGRGPPDRDLFPADRHPSRRVRSHRRCRCDCAAAGVRSRAQDRRRHQRRAFLPRRSRRHGGAQGAAHQPVRSRGEGRGAARLCSAATPIAAPAPLQSISPRSARCRTAPWSGAPAHAKATS